MASAGTAYVDVEARTDDVASAIESALSSVDGTVEAVVEADVSTAQSEIDSLESSPVDVPVDADVETAQSEIDGIDGGQAEVAVTADTAQAQASIDDLSGSIGALGDVAGVGGAGGAVGGLTDELAGLVGVSGGVAAGLGVAVGAFGMAIDAAGDAQVVVAETDSILGSLGDSAVVTGGHIAELSQRVMEYSGFSDEAVRAGANTLLMFDEIRSAEVFDRAIEGAADLARRMNTDVPTAARLLGMALQDPEAGMARLRRAGITLTEAQKEQVASFMAVGDTAAAQEVILASLEGRIGNLAEDYGETMKGGVDQAREAMDELAEAAGSSLLPIMDGLSATVVDQADMWQDWDDALNGALLSGPIQAIAGIGDGMRGVGTVIGDLPPALGGTADAADEAAQAFSDLSAEMDDYLNAVVNIPASQRDVQQSITDLTATLADNESSWFDIADAQDDVVVSTADLIQQMAEQDASQEELDGVIANTIGMLRSERDQGRITAQQFSDLAGEIRGIPNKATTVTTAPGLSQVYGTATNYRAMMDRIDGDTVSSTFIANGLNRIYMDSVNYRAIMNDLDGRVVTTYTKNIALSPLPKYASGTESAMAGLAVVGEEGPELVVFGGGERVIPAGQTQSMLAAGGTGQAAGASIVVNVHGSATAADGQAVVDALRRWQQRNGPVPVKVSA